MDVSKAFICARTLTQSGYQIVMVATDERASLAIKVGKQPSLEDLIELQETCDRLGIVTAVDAHAGHIRVLVSDYKPKEPDPHANGAPDGADLARSIAEVVR